MDESSQQVIDFVYNVVEPNSSLIDPPSPEGSAEVIQLVNQLVEKVCYQEITAAEAASELFTAVNERSSHEFKVTLKQRKHGRGDLHPAVYPGLPAVYGSSHGNFSVLFLL